jgi:hypothetical protein
VGLDVGRKGGHSNNKLQIMPPIVKSADVISAILFRHLFGALRRNGDAAIGHWTIPLRPTPFHPSWHQTGHVLNWLLLIAGLFKGMPEWPPLTMIDFKHDLSPISDA